MCTTRDRSDQRFYVIVLTQWSVRRSVHNPKGHITANRTSKTFLDSILTLSAFFFSQGKREYKWKKNIPNSKVATSAMVKTSL